MIYVLAAGLLLSTPGYSQFKNLLNKVKSKVDQRVDRKVDNTIDKTLDKAEGKGTDNAVASTGGGGGGQGTGASEPALKSFSKYDFVPGEKVLYAEDFSEDAIGELSTNWNSDGSG